MGLIVAGVCFIAPAMLIVLGLAWLYVSHGQKPAAGAALLGVKAAMVAIVAVALVRFFRTGVKDVFTGVLAVLAAAAAFVWPRSELIVLAAAALLGVIWHGGRRSAVQTQAAATNTSRPRAGAIPLAFLPAAGGAFWGQIGAMSLVFLKVGATLFGSGYVLANYLYSDIVERRAWMTPSQLLDAIAVGQVTPGPLLTTATFIGYVLGARNFGGGMTGGVIGGFAATVAIFLPSFLIVGVLGPALPRIRNNRWVRGALDGMNAAVVALILVVAVWLARDTLWAGGRVQWLAAGVFVAALAVLLWTKVNATWVIAVAAAVGWASR
jgi:chromate transporter